MALLGTGAICIWNGITPEGRAEFYDWHLNEHMPERAAIPGFLRSRRFIAATPETQPEFFTFYETADPGVMTGEAYRARLNAPTEWTRRATQAFRDTSRALTTVLASEGPGMGGLLATLRFAVREGQEQLAASLLRDGVAKAAKDARIAGAHLCRTNEDASASRTAESRGRTDILAAPSWVLIVEACDEAAARFGMETALAQGARCLEPQRALGLYRFEYSC